MSFWLLNMLFESEGDAEAREKAAERKRQERLKKQRIEEKKRQLELDKIRDSAGLGGSGIFSESEDGSDPYAKYSGVKPQNGNPKSPESPMISALRMGFGRMEVATGYHHGARQNSGGTRAVGQISPIRRPI